MNVNSYQSPIYLPQGIASPNGEIGYISNAGQEIDAIDLLTGELFWKTNFATHPLIVWENLLVAFRFLEADRTVIQIVVLKSSQNGAPVLSSQPVKFPEWITPDTNNDSFSFKVYLDRNVLILIWIARKMYEGGAPPPKFILERENKQDCGKIHVDLKTGEVETLPPENISEFRPEKLPQKDGFFEINAWKINNKAAALFLDISSNTPAFYLQVWNISTKQIYHLTKLIEGDGLVHNITLDGLYVLIHQEIKSGAGNFLNNSWIIFSVETGEKVAVLTYERNTKEASIISSNIFYSVEERSQSFQKLVLKAKEIATGRALWERLLFEQPFFAPPALFQ